MKKKTYDLDDLLERMPRFKEIENFDKKYPREEVANTLGMSLELTALTSNSDSNVFAVAIPTTIQKTNKAPFNQRAIPFVRRFSKTIGRNEDFDEKRDGRTRKEEKLLINKLRGKLKAENKNCYLDFKRINKYIREMTEYRNRAIKQDCFQSEALRKSWVAILTELLNWRIRLDLRGVAFPQDKLLSKRAVRSKLPKS